MRAAARPRENMNCGGRSQRVIVQIIKYSLRIALYYQYRFIFTIQLLLMKKILATLVALWFLLPAHGQTSPLLDSLQREYAKPKEFKDKVKLLENLAWATMNSNLAQADKYGEELIILAEKSRDKEAIVKAYIANGVRCSAGAGLQGYAEKAMHFFDEGKALAQKSKLEKYQRYILVQQAELQLQLTNLENAAKYLDQATALGADKTDSTLAVLTLAKGNIQLARNEKNNALRSYLTALRLADGISNALLQRQGLLKLSAFYNNIEDYDKAIDYHIQATKKLDELPARYQTRYTKVGDTKSIGELYAAKKNYALAKSYYEESIRMADSLQYPPLKMSGYMGLLNVYILMKEPHKSLAFITSEEGKKLQAFLQNLNMGAVVDQAYAVIYSEMGKLDSAGKYFDRCASFFKNSSNSAYKLNNLAQTANYLKRKGDNQQAINQLLQAVDIAKKIGQLDYIVEISKDLDTLYNNMGDYRQSKIYSALYYQYKDSLQTLNKEKELSQIAADDELQQLQKEQLALEEKKQARNNLQYIAITVGIITIFFLLALLGMFRVSVRTIKTVGFFAFLMFFEFIFLLSKSAMASPGLTYCS
jgi:tetratricopeptide (TPR) repeat protein